MLRTAQSHPPDSAGCRAPRWRSSTRASSPATRARTHGADVDSAHVDRDRLLECGTSLPPLRPKLHLRGAQDQRRLVAGARPGRAASVGRGARASVTPASRSTTAAADSEPGRATRPVGAAATVPGASSPQPPGARTAPTRRRERRRDTRRADGGAAGRRAIGRPVSARDGHAEELRTRGWLLRATTGGIGQVASGTVTVTIRGNRIRGARRELWGLGPASRRPSLTLRLDIR